MRGERAKAKVEKLKAEHAELKAQIPADWKERSSAFSKIQCKEQTARQTYRRLSDQAYEPLQETLKVLHDTSAYVALKAEFDTLEPKLDELKPDAFVDYAADLRCGGHVGSALGGQRRA
ncbi:hypothetical protein [Breoghania sp.]|uniref:hypothetical protein n=1 Tax=Breoghania sp. TaxID=2065378 RepID=UPI0026037816|nr:hypothetical protein [Breoghania sp.]MDJ0932498.1 hypothetical protein [Breoghania sp.]